MLIRPDYVEACGLNLESFMKTIELVSKKVRALPQNVDVREVIAVFEKELTMRELAIVYVSLQESHFGFIDVMGLGKLYSIFINQTKNEINPKQEPPTKPSILKSIK